MCAKQGRIISTAPKLNKLVNSVFFSPLSTLESNFVTERKPSTYFSIRHSGREIEWWRGLFHNSTPRPLTSLFPPCCQIKEFFHMCVLLLLPFADWLSTSKPACILPVLFDIRTIAWVDIRVGTCIKIKIVPPILVFSFAIHSKLLFTHPNSTVCSY